MHPLKTLLDQRHQSELKGIISICTASPMVIKHVSIITNQLKVL